MRLVAGLLLLPSLAPAQDPAQDLDEDEVARIVDEYLAARDAALEPSPWDGFFERFSASGDLRLRAESSEIAAPGDDDERERMRLRARLGATWAVDDSVLVGGRLVTGSREDPRSPHATFGDGFEGLELSLDRAFLTWRPAAIESAWVTAGKFANPQRTNPVYGEFAWDADVQPEGIALGWGADLGANGTRLELSAGEYILVEQSLAEESLATAVQVALTSPLAAGVEGQLSVGWFRVSDPTPDGGTQLVGKNGGNALEDRDGDGTPDGFAEDFGVLDVVASVRLDRGERPLTLAVEALENLEAAEESSGYVLGLSWGRASRAGDWRVVLQRHHVEREAVFSVFAQDDSPRTTDHEGWLAGVNRQLTDDIGLRFWGMTSEPIEGDGEDLWRLRLDLNVKF